MMKTKIFAAYLPQYHIIEDNNLFWGDGYTDWDSVKNATPLFSGHNQPRVPLNHNYYDLTDHKTIQWQADLANKYGVDGFNIYHYWFKDGKQELEKPAEILLAHSEINIEYFFTWDNCAWRRSWSNVRGNDWAPLYEKKGNSAVEGCPILIEFDYGEEQQWIEHFNYLFPFFSDKRYLKIDNKPVFLFMTTIEHGVLRKMAHFWDGLARQNGFNGMYFATQRGLFCNRIELDGLFTYEPVYSSWGKRKALYKKIKKIIPLNYNLRDRYIYDYQTVWKRIIRNTRRTEGIHGCFVRYDDTPRRGKDAGIVLGEEPIVFENFFRVFYEICSKRKEPFVLITAWNEWGEGAYLEPDEDSGYSFLEALHRAILS